ncbi:MAG: GNAT family N-acetyltransferase [Hyphomicrobiaceae bacterium]
MTLVIRPAVPADRSALHRLLTEIIDYFEGLAEGELEVRPSPEDLWRTAGLSFGETPFCETLIGELDGRPAGYLGYHFGVYEVFPALFVAGLFVTEAARGKGVGRELMGRAREIAAARGASHMSWMVWRRNEAAIGFYRGLGAELAEDDRQMAMAVRR